MRLRSIGFLLILAAELSYAIRPPSNEINVEKRREEQERLRYIQEISKSKIQRKNELNEIIEPAEEKGSEIKKIIIKGNSVVSSFDLKIIAKKYIGKKGLTILVRPFSLCCYAYHS